MAREKYFRMLGHQHGSTDLSKNENKKWLRSPAQTTDGCVYARMPMGSAYVQRIPLCAALFFDLQAYPDMKNNKILFYRFSPLARLNRIWRCNTISFASKFKLYKSLVTPILLYDCETRTLLVDSEKKKYSGFQNHINEGTSPRLLLGAQDHRLGA